MSLENKSKFEISNIHSLYEGRIYSHVKEKRNLRNVLDLLVQYLYIHVDTKEFYSASEVIYQIDDLINEMHEEDIDGTITTIQGQSRRNYYKRSKDAPRPTGESTQGPIC